MFVVKSLNVYRLSSLRGPRGVAGVLLGIHIAGCGSARFQAEPQGENERETRDVATETSSRSDVQSEFSLRPLPTSSDGAETATSTILDASDDLGTTVGFGGADASVSDVSIDVVTGALTAELTADATFASWGLATPSVEVRSELEAGTASEQASDAGLDAGTSMGSDDAAVGRSGASDLDTSQPNDPNVCNSGDFGTPQLVLGLGYDDRMWGPAISSDGNVLLFGYTSDNEDLYMATMEPGESRTFENLTALTSLNTAGNEGTPFLSHDALTLYFYATREGGPGDRDLWFATRQEVRDDFGEPEQVLGVNGATYDHLPWLSDDELTLYYTTERQGGIGHSDIWKATRASKSDAFADHTLVPGINSEDREDAIAFSPDRLTVYFTTDRDTDGNLDIWRATRSSRGADFADPEEVPGLNSDTEDTNLALTRDGKRLYFSSGRDGKQRLWVAARTCF